MLRRELDRGSFKLEGIIEGFYSIESRFHYDKALTFVLLLKIQREQGGRNKKAARPWMKDFKEGHNHYIESRRYLSLNPRV
jgi:hypothetical protein